MLKENFYVLPTKKEIKRLRAINKGYKKEYLLPI